MKYLLPLLLLLLAPQPATPAQPLQIRLYPYGYVNGPLSELMISTHIERNAANTQAGWALVSVEGYATSSEWELQGEQSAEFYHTTLRDVPAGHYVATAMVQQGKKRLVAQSQPLVVLP